MDPGAYGLVFCSALKLKMWYEVIVDKIEAVVNKDEVVEREEA